MSAAAAADLSVHEPDPSLLIARAAGALPLAYFSRGYETGYKQAVNDLLSDLIPMCERFIESQPGRGEDLRKLLYPFEHFLEQRISRMTPDGAYVEGGLGI